MLPSRLITSSFISLGSMVTDGLCHVAIGSIIICVRIVCIEWTTATFYHCSGLWVDARCSFKLRTNDKFLFLLFSSSFLLFVRRYWYYFTSENNIILKRPIFSIQKFSTNSHVTSFWNKSHHECAVLDSPIWWPSAATTTHQCVVRASTYIVGGW